MNVQTSNAQHVSTPGWHDLREWLEEAGAIGQLRRISATVDPDEELTAIAFLASREPGSEALVFDSFADNAEQARVLINMLGASKERYALTVGIDPGLSLREMILATRRISGRRLPPKIVAAEAAPVNEIVRRGDEIDLTRLPSPRFWPADGGRYMGTGCVTFIPNPHTGVINAGIYRQMLHGPRKLGLNMVPGRHGAQNCEAWWAMGKPCPVVVAHGVDPAMFIAASQVFGHDDSEIDAAGGMVGRPQEFFAGELEGLLLPARAELVIEGLIHQGETAMEGPFGEFHGYYSALKGGERPVITAEVVHQRASPILTAALMATYPSCEIGEYHAIMRSARVWDNLESMGVSGIAGVYVYPASASAAGLMVVSLKQLYAGHAAQVLALAAQCPAAAYCIRWVVAVDDDVDPTNINEVIWAMSVRSNPSDDIDILRNTWSFRMDPSLAPDVRPYGSKALIDACAPKRFKTTDTRTYLRRSVYDRVAARWDELGLPGRIPHQTHFYSEQE